MRLSEEQVNLKNTIRDVNRRINRIAEEYGIESQIYKENVSFLQSNFSDFIYKNERGEIQLSQKIRNSDYFNKGKNTEKMKLVTNQLRNRVQTVGQTLEPAEREASRRGVTMSKKDLKTLAEKLSKIEDDFENMLQVFYVIQKTLATIGDLDDVGFSKEFQKKIQDANNILFGNVRNEKGQISHNEMEKFIDLVDSLSKETDSVLNKFKERSKKNADYYKQKRKERYGE